MLARLAGTDRSSVCKSATNIKFNGGDVYSPMKADSTVKQTTDRRQTDLTTNEKRQPDENHYKLLQK